MDERWVKLVILHVPAAHLGTLGVDWDYGGSWEDSGVVIMGPYK